MWIELNLYLAAMIKTGNTHQWDHNYMYISTRIMVTDGIGVRFNIQRLLLEQMLCNQIHWASKETDHFFRATLTKIRSIKINHNWAQISYSTPYQAHLKRKVCLSQKGAKCSEITRGYFFIDHRNCSPPSTEFGMDKSQYGGYILNLPLKFNKQYFSWLFAISLQFCPFWQKQPFDLSDVLH